MEPISAIKFQSLLSDGEDLIDKEISGDVRIYANPFGIYLLIERCVFNGSLTLNDVEFNKDVVFRNCVFNGIVSFYNVTFSKKLEFANSRSNDRLEIANCVFSELYFKGGKFNNVQFKGILNEVANVKTLIEFQSGTYERLGFYCKEITCPIQFSGGSYEFIFFEKTKFYNSLSIDGLQLVIKRFYFQSVDFFDRISFSECLIDGDVNFHNVSFNEQVIFNRNFTCDALYFSNVIAKQDVSLNYGGNLSWLDISTCDFQTSLNCYNYNAYDLAQGERKLTCNINGIVRGNILLEGIPVSSLTISGVNFGNVIFKKIETHFITIVDFNNHNKLTFSGLKLNGLYNVFIIFDSNVNSTEFVNIDFRKFHEFVISKSEVSNILLSNSILPSKLQIGTKHPQYGYVIKADEKINDNTYFRESYRQLKLAMEKQGNKSYALAFKAKEMFYLRREVPFGWDKVLLYLNYWSNNNGLSWSRGLIFTFLISWIMFLLYEHTLIHSSFYWSLSITKTEAIQGFRNGFDGFLNFLASFPLFKKLENDKNTAATNAVFIASRILIGYGIYQTITAFRKFGSK
ncbi:pentapeptide repeat-containing protein [Mucilaginibacter rigui]|uniref:Pentapeptide repeat-containing protein n=1 Tax=Mucilaginibacter rigui TaxID=534635 RepID=A0ABR7X8X9_9SPHI|nr:pentapeptide repeat-containing protein [Mucilaginibacter rigui]MBD1387027.1 pentapeptide repeat-containing protein [Mucilaginibacter rigui]